MSFCISSKCLLIQESLDYCTGKQHTNTWEEENKILFPYNIFQ